MPQLQRSMVQLGDVVRDLDARRPMTVTSVRHDGKVAICCWFEGGDVRAAAFDVRTLLPQDNEQMQLHAPRR